MFGQKKKNKHGDENIKGGFNPDHGWFNTVHWMLTAFSATLVFLVFEMQAYTIPTGSMADTLKGAHFRLRCTQCGYRFDFDYQPAYYKMPENAVPPVDLPLRPAPPRCPSCGYYMESGDNYPVIAGDRIFVLKCIYQFFEPKRWDVIVFRAPMDPRINYIKRLIGLPGEKVSIIDGDVYVDGVIQRKPQHVQDELWMPVYNNNYQPVEPLSMRFNGHSWKQPFKNTDGSNWGTIGEQETIFTLAESKAQRVHTIFYDTSQGNDFTATHSYDDPRRFSFMPLCSDIMVEFKVSGLARDSEEMIGASLSKYGIEYRAMLEGSGKLTISKVVHNGTLEELATVEAGGDIDRGGDFDFSLANVDHQLVAKAGGAVLNYKLGDGVDGAGEIKDIMPEVKIHGAGELSITDVAIWRDLHYISKDGPGFDVKQAEEGQEFELEDGQYFVCGDNTPASNDSRMWDRPSEGNSGILYRQGIVPRDYLVGKAFVIYWPGPGKPFSRFKMVPYLEGMKFIYGGGGSEYGSGERGFF